MQDVLSRPAPGPDETLRYGPGADQVASADLDRPENYVAARLGPAPGVSRRLGRPAYCRS